MNLESKKLLNQFACALSNETIYGEGDHASLKRCREYAAKTEDARKALEAHIEQLESATAAGAGSAQPRAEMTDMYADLTKVIFDRYPRIKGAHCASIAYGIMEYLNRTETATAAGAQPRAEVDERALPSFSISRFSDTAQRGVLVVFDRRLSDGELETVRAALARAPLPAQGGVQPALMRQAVASVVSRSGNDLRVGWLRPERCDVGTLLYCAAEPVKAQPVDDARDAARWRFIVKDGKNISGRFTLVRADDSGRLDELHGGEYNRVIDAAMRANDSAAEGGK